ncbi:sensor domain-containing diguanylate cyclase [Glaciimonas immobilis]|uniref:diguanylate cyclase n=1 Tax=Glaciimonas immobilis TaxID=728004 RepID=A0A840RP40_9BURK|nr:sensor domain-containing diguanylate cyclase [Glaciimonas immobilis]KAF3999293.1 GGDEF domain-containing protein [Glaciimonas immobilis]MBB5198766.1 diguanylate cyclase (GGDEF)-like protein [Glaciimonas immobilis]
MSITWLAGFFVVLVCVSLVFVDGLRSWTARTTQLHEMDIATSNMARAIAQQADDTIKEADTVLVGLVERIQTDGVNPAALGRLHALLAVRVAALPQLNGIFLYDENGRWLTNSRASPVSDLNNSDRDYFIYHRTHGEPRPYIGLPIRSRSTGEWIITLSRRINHADGSFAGVALATINISYFNKFYESFDIGRHGAITLALDGAVMLTRRPLLKDSIGKNISNYPLWRYVVDAQGGAGTVILKSALDGVKRLYSFRRLDRYPLFVSVALSQDEILADWRADTYLHSAGVLILLIVLVLLGFYLIRQIKVREEAEAEIVRARDALELLNHALQRQTLQDELTGLSNRRHFDIALEKEFSRATRNVSSLALIMIDVDCFKQYNDLYGHVAGDECLRRISAIIRSGQRRPGDVAARYGGEELSVLLPGTDMDGALLIAENIRLSIASLAIAHAGSPLGIVTISAGIDVLIPVRHKNNALQLLQAADKALYAAKTGGRNRVCCSVPP